MADDNNPDDLIPASDEQLEELFARPLTENDFYYLLSRWPYLDIMSVEDKKELPVQIIPAKKSGWRILDYGNRLCASGAIEQFGDWGNPKSFEEALREDEEGGGAGTRGRGKGTHVQQMVDTADVMITLANQRWDGVRVMSGFYGMIRAAWIFAEGFNLYMDGFDPTPEDQVVRNWVEKLCGANRGKVPRPPQP